ncbi:MAG: isopentenyl-diphosphate Delta-isomerase [Streptosporangiaceae bacterium]
MEISTQAQPQPPASSSRPEAGEELELVDDAGQTVGVARKLAAHQAPGHLHRAFSVFLFSAAAPGPALSGPALSGPAPSGPAPSGPAPSGPLMLLQRRAAGKYHSPGVWSNTCCGHPRPREDPRAAAVRRVREELGLTSVALNEAGIVRYRHPDPDTGLVEHEYNHLFTGWVSQLPEPDPAEVSATTFVSAADLARLRGREPFSAWFDTVLEAARPALRQLTGSEAGW